MRIELPVILFVGAVLGACGGRSAGSTESPAAGAASPAAPKTVDACALVTQKDIATLVGNQVGQGQAFAGTEVCKWDAEPNNVSVLLTVRPAGSLRETVLCPELRKSTEGQRLEGIGDVAVWKFSNTMGLFNSGEFEACGRKGYVGVSLNGPGDEAHLKDATVAIARKVLEAL